MTHLPPEAVVAEVRAEMARQGVTASKVAEATDMAQPTLSRKLSGSREFTLAEFIDVCGVLRVSPAVMVERAERLAVPA